MINSVSSVEIKPLTSEIQKTNAQEYFITPEVARDIFETEEKHKDKKGKKTGIFIVVASVVTAGAALIATKGLPRIAYPKMKKWANALENKIKIRKENKASNYLTKYYNKLLEKINMIKERAESINNVTSYKDLLFKRVMDKTKFTHKIHSSITSYFERLAMNTVKRGYKKSDKSFEKLFRKYAKVNKKLLKNPNKEVTINGIKKTIAGWIDEISIRQNAVQKVLSNDFSAEARSVRYKEMKKACDGLDDRILKTATDGYGPIGQVKQNIKILKESPLHKTFIAEKELAPAKRVIGEKVESAKDNLVDVIKGSDNLSILEIYKALLSQGEFLGIRTKTNSAIRKLDSAVKMENDRFFDKLRDLTLGSAPTDVLTIVGSLGGVGVGLATADNKDERISATLKYGIPILGSIATTLVLTVSMVAGFASMAIGTVSGLAMNKLGASADKYRKLQNKIAEDNAHAEAVKAEIRAENSANS